MGFIIEASGTPTTLPRKWGHFQLGKSQSPAAFALSTLSRTITTIASLENASPMEQSRTLCTPPRKVSQGGFLSL